MLCITTMAGGAVPFPSPAVSPPFRAVIAGLRAAKGRAHSQTDLIFLGPTMTSTENSLELQQGS